MSKDNWRIVAIACGAVLLLLAKDRGSDLMQFSGRPTLEQLAVALAGGGGVWAVVKAWFSGGGGGPSLNLLQSIKQILEQFKTQGVPDEFSLIVRWGEEVYEADWKKRPRVEPKK